MANVTIVMILFFLIFGMVCINFFKGKLFVCSIDALTFTNKVKIEEKWTCLNVGGLWLSKAKQLQ